MRRVVLLSVVVEALADAVAVDKERRSGRSVERNIGDREVENVEGVVTGTCQLARQQARRQGCCAWST